MRVVLAVVGAVLISGCASSSYYTVKRVDAPGTCMTTAPQRDLLTVIPLRHTDAKFAADLSDMPAACKAEPLPMKTLDEVEDRIAAIPTRLGLTSECDRALIYAAATKVVAAHRDEILQYLNHPSE